MISAAIGLTDLFGAMSAIVCQVCIRFLFFTTKPGGIISGNSRQQLLVGPSGELLGPFQSEPVPFHQMLDSGNSMPEY